MIAGFSEWVGLEYCRHQSNSLVSGFLLTSITKGQNKPAPCSKLPLPRPPRQTPGTSNGQQRAISHGALEHVLLTDCHLGQLKASVLGTLKTYTVSNPEQVDPISLAQIQMWETGSQRPAPVDWSEKPYSICLFVPLTKNDTPQKLKP